MTTRPDVTTDLLPDDPEWYRDAVIYELHVRAFFDANDDGIGDFRGLTQKLDYLQDLGVTAIWLLPFYPSPLRDDGYDIADYRGVHPDYGTLPQFQRFVDEAHRRGLRVINELVINHTSDQHPWFKRAVRAPKGSPERDWYVWNDTPDRWPEVRVIFQDFEASNWTYHGQAGQYYWHRFYSHQPDLNFDNPEVRQAVKDVLDHWAGMGVDGMRLDAIPYLFERDGTNGENLPETHAFLKELRAHLDTWDNRMFLAEANQWPEDAAAYFGEDGDECHMNFHFPLMPRLFMAVAQEDRFPIIDILQQTPETPPGSQWAVFLRNHDELTLEMVTDEERDYMYRAYAHETRMRVNLGIRRRLAPLLGNDRRLIELMNSLLFTMPGTPVLYYGDEIGMGDNIYLGDRNGVRTPMQWSPDRNAGFSKANPQRLYLPTIIDPEYHYEAINVEAQHNNSRSLLWWMRRTIALRRRFEAFGRGTIEFLHPDNTKILAFLRRYRDETILCVANLSRYAQACELDLAEYDGLAPIELSGGSTFPEIGELPYLLTLAPYAFHWFSIQPARQRVQASATGEPAAATEPEQAESADLPRVSVSGEWTSLLSGRGRQRLAAVLPDVLQRQRWFGGKARPVRSATIQEVVDAAADDDADARILIVRVEYGDGHPEDYVVPVAFASGEAAGELRVGAPRSLLVEVVGRSEDADSGVLYDGLADESISRSLLRMILEQRRQESSAGDLVGTRLGGDVTLENLEDATAQPLKGEQSNTSVLFGETLLMKVMRKLEPGTSPDVEIGRFLAGKGFEHVPELLGTLELQPSRGGEPRTLAMLQPFIESAGDAWKFTLDELGRYGERVMSDTPTDARPEAGATRSVAELASHRIPERVYDVIGGYLDAAELLGRRTAQLHNVLASADADDAFRPETFSSLYQRSLYQSMRNAVRKGFRAARSGSSRLSPEDRQRLAAVLNREPDILQRLRRLSTESFDVARIRTHGDYHLGQVLWTGRDFVILDFEGEPARPLGERRIKRTGLRDVAGMLRSFEYATFSVVDELRERGDLGVDGHAHEQELDAWLGYWRRWVSATFLRGYLEATKPPVVPADPAATAMLLDAYLLEKAVYELGYEMNNRPDWVHIPIAGIERVLDAPA